MRFFPFDCNFPYPGKYGRRERHRRGSGGRWRSADATVTLQSVLEDGVSKEAFEAIASGQTRCDLA